MPLTCFLPVCSFPNLKASAELKKQEAEAKKLKEEEKKAEKAADGMFRAKDLFVCLRVRKHQILFTLDSYTIHPIFNSREKGKGFSTS